MTALERDIVSVATPELPRAGWGAYPCNGLYTRPAGTMPSTAFIAVHYNLDFSDHYLAVPLAERGYGFLGWNTRFCGNEAYFLLDRALVDIGAGVGWLRDHGVKTVVLLGNSGGASLVSAYQAQSQAPFAEAPSGMELAAGVDELPGGDLFVSIAAHPGRPVVLTNWLDPAVVDELDPVATDQDLDMYNPANGPPYAPVFVSRYRAAQRERNRRITAWALTELDRVRDAGFSDRLFTLQRTWADLRFVDPGLDANERPTPACYAGDPARANRGVVGLGATSTLRTWLSSWSLDESQCKAEDHLPVIELPALVVQATMDTGVFPSDAATIRDHLRSADKTSLEVPGDHYFRTPNGARDMLAGLVRDWVAARSA